MACLYRPALNTLFLFYFIVTLCWFSNLASASRELDEDNWRDILEGEWMVEFYAPWCPACKALSPAWSELSTRSSRKSLKMKAAAVDVTKSPGLSGRFMVTALPSIYHVIDGEFRQYKGPREVESMLSYVEKQRWKQTDAVPSWKAPDSLQMNAVAQLFRLSHLLRGVHNTLMETYGLPTWGSYLIFAVATIFIGAILGLLLVCLIDLLYPPKKVDRAFISKAEADKLGRGDVDKDKERSDDDIELINDDIVDESQSADSDAEKNSPSDSSDDEKPAAAGDTKTSDTNDKPEVRKRRPRKAD